MRIQSFFAVAACLACSNLLMAAFQSPAPPPPRPKRPGVTAPGVRIPITKLKPEAVYEVPGAPDWMAGDKEMWVSDEPKNTVSRLDPKSSAVTTFAVGKNPCSGLATGFGS